MKKPVALFDMDGTLADFDSAMRRDLLALHNPQEGDFGYEYWLKTNLGDDNKDPAWLKVRKNMIKRQPGWWLNLQPIPEGMAVLEMARSIGFKIRICSRGPQSNPQAWAEKVMWVNKHLPRTPVTLADDKSSVYGRVLVDDWPDYVEPWLKVRARGNVLMPHRTWNKDFNHERCIKYDATCLDEVRQILKFQFTRELAK